MRDERTRVVPLWSSGIDTAGGNVEGTVGCAEMVGFVTFCRFWMDDVCDDSVEGRRWLQ